MIYKVVIENGICVSAIPWRGDYIVPMVQYYYSTNGDRISEYALVEAETEAEAIKEANKLL